jgi:hypothetical protein
MLSSPSGRIDDIHEVDAGKFAPEAILAYLDISPQEALHDHKIIKQLKNKPVSLLDKQPRVFGLSYHHVCSRL